MSDPKAKAQELKALANKAFSAGEFQAAIEKFSAAIELDPNDHVFFRSVALSFHCENFVQQSFSLLRKFKPIRQGYKVVVCSIFMLYEGPSRWKRVCQVETRLRKGARTVQWFH